MSVDYKQIGRRAGLVGIVVNVILCVSKLIGGYLTNSISIISDGFNNLTDILNAILVYVGYNLANKPADSEHPYGHGRIEYMLSQGISIMIVVVGITLLRASVSRVLNPQDITPNNYVLFFLIFSVVVKLCLAYYYDRLYKKSSISTLHAQKTDSLADIAATSVIILGYLLFPLTNLPLDGIIGICVSFIIIYSGVEIFREMASILVGVPADEKLYDEIISIIKSHDSVKGYHDLRIHTYGTNNIYGTSDIELDGKQTLFEAHTIIDSIEDEVYQKTGVQMTFHADPTDEHKHIHQYQDLLSKLLEDLEENVSFHDLHFNQELNKYIVDIEIPYHSKYEEKDIIKYVLDGFKKENIDINLEIRIDRK